MAIRYTDLDLDTSGARDFVIRKRTPTVVQLAILFAVTLFLSIILISTISNKSLLVLLLLAFIGGSGWYVVVSMQHSRDLLMATEFQNALFASALGLHNKFCMIIRRNGNIIYLDRLFQDMFPDFMRQQTRSIDALLEQGRVSQSDSEKIYSAIERGVYEKVIFDIRGGDSRFTKVVMSIEPILRPSGFILLRGREFIETRKAGGGAAGTASASNLMSKSSITLFSHVMDTMNMGVYMTGPTGSLIYVNPVLEQWLGFNEGEIAGGNLSLQDIIHQGGTRADAIEPGDYEGEIMLQKKTGAMMKSFVNQKIIRDESGKILGCTALVHHFTEQGGGKNKPW